MKRALAVPEREAITSSADFLAYVDLQRTDAQRRRDDWLSKIEERQTVRARAKTDHERNLIAIDEEIADFRDSVSDEQAIIDAAERALTMERPAPKLTPHVEEQQ